VRFAIVGTGVAARYHAQAIRACPDAQLVALCRPGGEPARAAKAESEFGVPCDTDLDRLLSRPDVDAVCICTPSGEHARESVAALRSGRHVLVEKPMALTLEDADAMIAAARAAGAVLGVSLQRRTEPAYRAAHDAVASGGFGKLVLATTTVPYWRSAEYYANTPWRGTWATDGGGALMNQGIHLVDLLLWIAGDVAEVQSVASTSTHRIEVEDDLVATLRFASGALGSIVATTAAAPGFPHRIEVYGDRGGTQIEGEAVVRWEGAPEHRPSLSEAPASAGSGGSPTGLAPQGHARCLADFVAAVHDKRPPLVSGEEGRRSLALVLAIYEAARTGKPTRPLPPPKA
jgi:UDP-N-acetyl-2-amino-2-deoxyglucuronate dehydrogenase